MTKYRSNLERQFAARFPALPYEETKLPYETTHRYTTDFQLEPNVFVETKGLFDAADRAKHLAVRKTNPEVKVLFVFQNPHIRLSRTSKTTYADWCVKNNFAHTDIGTALSVKNTSDLMRFFTQTK